MKRARVLIVDDKESFLTLFRRISPPDLEIVCASDGSQALNLLTTERFDLVVSDIRMPGLDGLSLLRRIRDTGIDVEVVLMTAYGTIAEAVRAMKYGAADFLTKPFDTDDAVAAMEQALLRRRARLSAGEATGTPRLLGESPAMKRVFDLIARAAESDATVLITGESGTGKELVASAIHGMSPRAAKRFVPVNCGALPESLIESELFGHVKGAFTGAVASKRGLFEEAAGGTLFLDEVGELPLGVQVKLTRALQQRAIRKVGGNDEQSVDVRVIAATNIDLERAVEDARFREDLFYRLNVLAISLPPLRERREDIPLLADVLLARLSAAGGRPRRISNEALACIASYDWPGNVRQLENALARAAAVATGEELGVDSLPSEVRGASTTTPTTRPSGPPVSLPYREAIAAERERTTRDYLVNLLREVHGNVTQAAERAGIERESFHRLMKRHGVHAEDFRSK
jgi:two-component system response regulator AtoC